MLTERMWGAINDQIQAEAYSSYLYLAMAAWAETQNLPGTAHWLKAQSQEEWGHALKLFEYLNERGSYVELKAIQKPPPAYNSVLDIFEKVLAHEKVVTGRIDALYEVAVDEKDYASQSMLKWFIDEQVEEEATAGLIVERLKMAGTSGPALIMLDQYLGSR